ncbi:MAG: GNAT family N-acetyltransferase [Bacteroidales bacterium]
MWKKYLIVRETDRLIIRPLDKTDYLVWQEFIMDKVATKFFPDDWKLKPGKSEEWIELQLERYRENRYGLQALILKKSGEFIGQCGLLTQTIEGRNELEIGYHLIPRFWGNGFATESAGAFKKLGFENNLAGSLISIIDMENILSQKVAQRNGMKKETQTKFMDMDVYIYRIKLEEYVKTAPVKE